VSRKLTIDDILEPRAYERERPSFRAAVIAAKARRRVSVGTVLTVCFESRDTMRYQIQEMARVENLRTDAEVQDELNAYNPIIPERGELSATLFIELTSDDALREWLPRLVGIERHLVIRLADGDEVRCAPEAGHESQLTREHVTAAVHYVRWQFTQPQVAAFDDRALLVVDHPAYGDVAELLPSTVAELRADLTA
jgi:hypothetical protein